LPDTFWGLENRTGVLKFILVEVSWGDETQVLDATWGTQFLELVQKLWNSESVDLATG